MTFGQIWLATTNRYGYCAGVYTNEKYTYPVNLQEQQWIYNHIVFHINWMFHIRRYVRTRLKNIHHWKKAFFCRLKVRTFEKIIPLCFVRHNMASTLSICFLRLYPAVLTLHWVTIFLAAQNSYPLLYSGKFSLVQIFTKILFPSGRNFRV